jgi:hypothetical protein
MFLAIYQSSNSHPATPPNYMRMRFGLNPMLAISSVKHIHVLEQPCPSSKITQDVAACKLSESAQVTKFVVFRLVAAVEGENGGDASQR